MTVILDTEGKTIDDLLGSIDEPLRIGYSAIIKIKDSFPTYAEYLVDKIDHEHNMVTWVKISGPECEKYPDLYTTGTSVPRLASSRVFSYPDTTSLDAAGSDERTKGELAHVTATDSFYVWDGSEWVAVKGAEEEEEEYILSPKYYKPSETVCLSPESYKSKVDTEEDDYYIRAFNKRPDYSKWVGKIQDAKRQIIEETLEDEDLTYEEVPYVPLIVRDLGNIEDVSQYIREMCDKYKAQRASEEWWGNLPTVPDIDGML